MVCQSVWCVCVCVCVSIKFQVTVPMLCGKRRDLSTSITSDFAGRQSTSNPSFVCNAFDVVCGVGEVMLYLRQQRDGLVGQEGVFAGGIGAFALEDLFALKHLRLDHRVYCPAPQERNGGKRALVQIDVSLPSRPFRSVHELRGLVNVASAAAEQVAALVHDTRLTGG